MFCQFVRKTFEISILLQWAANGINGYDHSNETKMSSPTWPFSSFRGRIYETVAKNLIFYFQLIKCFEKYRSNARKLHFGNLFYSTPIHENVLFQTAALDYQVPTNVSKTAFSVFTSRAKAQVASASYCDRWASCLWCRIDGSWTYN